MRILRILALLNVVHWASCHVVYPKDLPRVRVEEWRPVRDDPFGRHAVRYPVFHKGHFGPSPPKKFPLRQSAEHSEKVEVFSPAPPSILGSFSLFGHATVNAREHASHMPKKPTRTALEDSRPAYSGYPVRHALLPDHHNTLPQRFQPYDDQNFFFEASLRPPPRGVNHPHSASLSPNSYYFEPPQPFQAPVADINMFHKARKPPHKAHPPFRNNGIFLDRFKGTTQTPALGFFEHGDRTELSKPVGNRGGHPYIDPFAPATRRPEPIDTIKGDRPPNTDAYQRLQKQHPGRPFQSSPQLSSVPSTQVDEEPQYRPHVTTFSPTPSAVDPFKFSPIGRPFQISEFDQMSPMSNVNTNFTISQRPYTREVFIGTTTSAPLREETEMPYVEVVHGTSPRPRPYQHQANYEPPALRRPQVQVSSYQGFNENAPPPPFLPTPSTGTETYINKPVSEEGSTVNPINYNEISKTPANQYYLDSQKPTEYYPDYLTTTIEPETTTRYRTPPSKLRRRPTRPTSVSKKPLEDSSNQDFNIKNHRIPEEDFFSSTTEFPKHHRRRKPHYPPYRGGSFGSKNRNGEYQKLRTTTTTTTPKPEEVTPVDNDYTVTDGEEPTTTIYVPNIQVEVYEGENDQYVEKIPLNEVQASGNEKYNNYYDEAGTTIQETTTTAGTPQITTTTPVPSTQPPSSTTSTSTRYKTKYNGNRPRFSVKDYREKLNRATAAPQTPHVEVSDASKTVADNIKYSIRNRGNSQYKASGDNETTHTTTEPRRKYKPRIGPSRYKTSTTPSLIETTTTERTYNFRPSTSKYKPGTGKYYSRYRTTSSPQQKETEEKVPTTTKSPLTRPKGVFSAKRRPFPLKPKIERHRNETTSQKVRYQNEPSKAVENEVLPSTTILSKKMDDVTTVTTAESIDAVISDPTGAEAMRVADLTSSSSNEFESSGFLKGVSPSSRRTIAKITIATDDPILPLEAFFQTQHNKDK